jgi:hypothetical protein
VRSCGEGNHKAPWPPLTPAYVPTIIAIRLYARVVGIQWLLVVSLKMDGGWDVICGGLNLMANDHDVVEIVPGKNFSS